MLLREERILFLAQWLSELAERMDALRLPGQVGAHVGRIALDSKDVFHMLRADVRAAYRRRKNERGGL
jgi:hypothetical protein